MNMSKSIKYLLLFVMLPLLGACTSTQEKKDIPSLPPVKYPYKASHEKEQMILTNNKKLTKGMPLADVVKLLGQPDEKTSIYLSEDDINDDKPVSFCYIYLIQRNTDKGSMLERNEKLLRVHFDNTSHMIRIEKIGIK